MSVKEIEIAERFCQANRLGSGDMFVRCSAAQTAVFPAFTNANGDRALDFQPHGATGDPKDPSRIVVADYYGPGVRIYRIEEAVVVDGPCIFLRLERDLGKVRYGSEMVRFFPELPKGSDRSRMQDIAAFKTPDGETRIIAWQNGEQDRFYVYVEELPSKAGDRLNWRLIDTVMLQGDCAGFMECGTVIEGVFYVVRSWEDPARPNSWLCAYELNGRQVETDMRCPPAPFIYGMGQRRGLTIFLTDPRCQLPLGAYGNDKDVIVAGPNGSGFVELPDGSAIVSRYGAGMREPGRLLWVPPSSFSGN